MNDKSDKLKEKTNEEKLIELKAYKKFYERSKNIGENDYNRLTDLFSRHSAKKWSEEKLMKMFRRKAAAEKKINDSINALSEIDIEVQNLEKQS